MFYLKNYNYTKPTLVYDGLCNLCNGLVRFVNLFNSKGVVNLISIEEASRNPFIDIEDIQQMATTSAVFIDNNGEKYYRSDAILKILKALGGFWLIPWIILTLLPKSIRDYCYNIIAKNRYQWFGKRDRCFCLHNE